MTEQIGNTLPSTVQVTVEHVDESQSVIPVVPEAIINNEHGHPVGIITESAQKGDVLVSVEPISVDVKK